MFEPILEVLKWIRSLLPTSWKLSRPKLNFITVHYCYMIIMTIIGSIMLYPAGGLAYIDALFFSAGMATQSGLNTVNVNDLCTYQQVVMMLLTCICTPIFINTVVVFVRLYWFEKRFEHIIQDIRDQRRSRARSFSSHFSKSRAKDEAQSPDNNMLERGVNGRPIKVLHDTTIPNGMSGPSAPPADQQGDVEKQGVEALAQSVDSTASGSSSDNNQQSVLNSGEQAPADEHEAEHTSTRSDEKRSDSASHGGAAKLGLQRGITFADEVPTPSDQPQLPLARVPNADMTNHISFLERQQNNAKKAGALRIPGPRDFDRGDLPEELNETEMLHRPRTRDSNLGSEKEMERGARRSTDEDSPRAAQPFRRAITINEPDRPDHRDRASEEIRPLSATGSRYDRFKNALVRRRSHGQRSLALGNDNSIAKTHNTFASTRSRDKNVDPSPYLSWQASTARNSVFLGLTENQREELGGIEYRSLKTLAGVLLGYYFGFHILGMVVLLPWIVYTQPWKSIVVNENGQSAAWWGIFTPASMFNDLGFTLTADSMNSFETAVLPLLFGSFLIVIGNTGFPCMLRFMIWVLSKVVTVGSGLWEELEFLLDHPRRCFTLLFPSRATWWLFWVLVLLNGIDLLFFVVLDLNNTPVSQLTGGFKVLNGWFQAVSTRTAGFSCVNISALHPAVQVSYMIMMYISVFPIAISVRRTNVYEERSLGIFGGEEAGNNDDDEPSYVGQHLRRQLSFDLWYIFLGLFIIAWVEGDRIQATNQPAFTMFAILFEIVSAYGTVGLSLGYPNIDASFSTEFRVISKLVIIAMMLRGRHRGLPYALDRAILLPSEKLQQKETEDAERRYARRPSIFDMRTSEIELDEYGLPMQHVDWNETSMTDPMTAGAGGPQGVGADMRRRSQQMLPRRSSMMSTNSRDNRRARSRSLARVFAGGLSAGPTYSRD